MNAQDCKNIAVSRPSPRPYAEIQTSGFLYSSGELKAAWAKLKPSWGGGGGACPEACSVRKSLEKWSQDPTISCILLVKTGGLQHGLLTKIT